MFHRQKKSEDWLCFALLIGTYTPLHSAHLLLCGTILSISMKQSGHRDKQLPFLHTSHNLLNEKSRRPPATPSTSVCVFNRCGINTSLGIVFFPTSYYYYLIMFLSVLQICNQVDCRGESLSSSFKTKWFNLFITGKPGSATLLCFICCTAVGAFITAACVVCCWVEMWKLDTFWARASLFTA